MVLLSLPDSAFVNGTVSGEDGAFTLEATSENQIVKISSIGYKTVCKPISPANIGIVQLVSDAQVLGEVVVKADLPKMQLKGDAMVTTVQGSILEKAGTGEDLLNKIPGVSAGDDEVNVFGSGTPEIYINGRKVRDNSELDQLASDQIKRVKVVKNPGARYDASVKAVIRIITKRPWAKVSVSITVLSQDTEERTDGLPSTNIISTTVKEDSTCLVHCWEANSVMGTIRCLV